MIKDYEGVFVTSQQAVAGEKQANNFSKQIEELGDKKILHVKTPIQDVVNDFQDTHKYERTVIGEMPSEYKRLSAYCLLVRDPERSWNIRTLYFNMPGNYTDRMPELKNWLNVESKSDEDLDKYIYSTLGSRAVRESSVSDHILGAVEFGQGLSGQKSKDGLGANLLIPTPLISFVPRIAGSLSFQAGFQPGVSPWAEYYREASKAELATQTTNKLVLSALIKATKNGVK
jgi:hypothetical protein